MTATAGVTARGHATRARRLHSGGLETLGLALLAYVPFLLSSPGQVAADTKQYLYLDPGSFLGRAISMWDPHVAAGTVPHQSIGYLFPMGPYFWLMDLVGMPDWIAQRLWLGTISLLAALGARWLFKELGARRWGALAGALVYMLTAYQLAFTARISVLLLAWAALPWIVGLTMRAVQRGGWLYPAALALVIMSAGSVNASSMLFMLLAPAIWIVLELVMRRVRFGTAAAAVGRIAVLTLGASLWWVVGLRIQGAYGLPVLQLTETVRVVASASTPLDLLRGLGNWFFYGTDRLGDSIQQAHYYVTNHVVTAFSFAVPIVALAAAAIVKWRHRTYFVLLVVVGTIVGAGAWPYDDPSLYGRAWRSFSANSSIGLALRNTPRVAPLLVLGLAGLLAAAVSALAGRRWRRVPIELLAAALVAVLAFGALLPVWRDGYLSPGVERPEDIPGYWNQVAAALTGQGDSTRVLEIPGANFSAYRWGNTVEPVTPGLTDRPYLAREVLPYGSPQTVNLLDALDRRMQEGTFEPTSLAAIARLFSTGTVVLRSDLAYERFGLPRPRAFWDQLTEPSVAPGLDAPVPYGPMTTNVSQIPLVDAQTLRDATKADPPAVALFGVRDAVPIVHTAPVDQPVVLDGDGDGIVDAAAAGLIDGNQLVQQVAALDDAELSAALARGADLVVTDSNRRRAETWFTSLRDDKGATERAGQTLPDPSGEDYRFDLFPGSADDARTVVVQQGGTVDASADGGTAHPENRAVGAFDGDLHTAWRVGGANPTGAQLTLIPATTVHADHVTLVQPQDGPRDRVLTHVSVIVNDKPPIAVDLGPDSLTPSGQRVDFPATDVTSLTIRTDATSTPLVNPAVANPVGFAEVRLGDVHVTELVRLPVDGTTRVGGRAASHALDYVLSRLRYDPTDADHQDQELALRRQFTVPDPRAFGMSGTARVNPNAPDATIDTVLGTTAPGTEFVASGHLRGVLDARASRAFDGSDASAWTAPIGAQTGHWVGVDLDAPITVNHLDLGVVADGQHSVPTKVHLEADGKTVATFDLPAITDEPTPGAVHQVPLDFAPVSARSFHLVVDDYRPVDPDGTLAIEPQTLPISFSEVAIPGVARPASPTTLSSACRDDLVQVDGAPLSVRVTGAVTDARTGLSLEACDGAVDLASGDHTITTATGLDVGVDVDRVVLSSAAGGTPTTVAPRGAALDTAGSKVHTVDAGSTSNTISVQTDGKPFWLVFGQSHNDGWEATTSGGRVGPQQLVDGYANGWLIRPDHAGTMTIHLRWTPQRLVWVGFAVSIAVVLLCLAICVVAGRRRRASFLPYAETPALDLSFTYAGSTPLVVLGLLTGVGVGLVTAAFSRPWIGVVAGVAAAVVTLVPRARVLVVVAIPLVLALSRIAHEPELAWLTIALLVVDLAARWVRSRR
ncbi:MAG TPA: alpha-(1-_3)-arabinofuranosyltransferase family protein [Acidimicrobiia bacterium]|nr:alpha-(1->3)-arabinofuranosyltransferase family protein [Acidimicrobiia bacterium]